MTSVLVIKEMLFVPKCQPWGTSALLGEHYALRFRHD